MSALRAVLDRLNDIEATIAQIEGNSTLENAFAYRLTLQSLETRRDALREELAEISQRDFVEICDYRIIPSNKLSYALSAVTGGLHDFQDLVTLLFDADPKKPKQRARIDPSSTEKTRFDFGFAYSGSLGVVLTKAVVRAADRLNLPNKVLGKIIGVSESTVSRMGAGDWFLPENHKAFELSAFFIRFYRSLDAIVGGDDSISAQWIRSYNTVLSGVPLEQIQTVQGLVDVIAYLDARRAVT